MRSAARSIDGRLEADGGLPELTWEKTGGTLPLGVAPDGSVVGFAAASCTSANFTLDVSVTDSDTPAQSASRTGIELAVEPREVGLPVSSSPPVASIGEPFSFDIAVSPGVEPYAFALAVGALPPGISLDGILGFLQGAPTTGGTYNFTVEVTDDCGTTDSRAFTIIVAAPRRAATTPSAPRPLSATADYGLHQPERGPEHRVRPGRGLLRGARPTRRPRSRST